MIKPILFATLLYLAASQCTHMKCMEDTTENKDKCQVLTNMAPLEAEVKKCASGKSCTKVDGATTYCEDAKKRVGEKCTAATECFSGKCEDNKCTAIEDGKACTVHEECDKTSYCDSTTRHCTKLLAENAECQFSLQCPFGYACGAKAEGEANKCLKMYQIEDGQYSSTAELCKSGYLSTKKVCSTYTVTKEGQECNQDSDCPVKEKDSEEEITISGQCVCNLNSGKSLCQYSYDKAEVKTYREKTISYFTTASNAGDYPVLAKLTPSYDVKKAEFSGSIEYKDAPQCVLDFMASSLLWVKVSFLTLVSILLF